MLKYKIINKFAIEGFILTGISLFFLLFCTGCGENNKKVEVFKSKNFTSFLGKAMKGEKVFNDSLKGLIDLSIQQPEKYNKITFDSIIVKGKTKLYAVLIEFENPVYNRLAVYDSAYRLYLMDKSLNGYLSLTKGKMDTINYFEVIENFRSKDDINLKRINLYTVRGDRVELSWRNYIEYSEGKNFREQVIEAISAKSITTGIKVEPRLRLVDLKDKFFFDSTSQKYESNKMVFNRLVDGWVAKYNRDVSDSQIVDLASSLKSLGTKTSVDSVHKYNNEKNKKAGFSIFIPEGWRVGRDVFITKYLKKPMKGSLYSNINQGAYVSVIELRADDLTENYIEYSLDQTVQRFYTVRFTENIVVKKNYIRFFEVSCIDKKYLLIFEAPIFSYDKNKEIYSEIINSFGVEC